MDGSSEFVSRIVLTFAGFRPGEGGGGGSDPPLKICGGYPPLIFTNTVQSTCCYEGGQALKPPKFEHIFVAVITSPPFLCANTFDTSLLLMVSALR